MTENTKQLQQQIAENTKQMADNTERLEKRIGNIKRDLSLIHI